MAHSYHEIAFTPKILDLQTDAGSRSGYASMGGSSRYADALTAREAEFIAQRDSFYMASVSESGWPYVQHRGGPSGFMKVLDGKTIGFADYSGNRQFVSTGNFYTDSRVSLFFMDYPNRRRLKMFGRVRVVDAAEADILSRLEDPDYGAQIERAFLISVEGFDWNCPAHITPRYTEAEIEATVASIVAEDHRLAPAPDGEGDAAADTNSNSDGAEAALGNGPLELVISGVRQLATRVRAYELRDPLGNDLPTVEAGAHLRVPVRLASGELTERHYSIASNPARRDVYEIAVLREDEGGGSAAIHASFEIGTRLLVDPPANHFGLHADDSPSVLLAAGIGITPIKAMAQVLDERRADFHLHYAGRSRIEMAFRDRLERQLGDRVSVYSKADGDRLDLEAVIAGSADDAVFYVCGPDRLLAGVLETARALGIPQSRIRTERFS